MKISGSRQTLAGHTDIHTLRHMKLLTEVKSRHTKFDIVVIYSKYMYVKEKTRETHLEIGILLRSPTIF